MRARHWGAKSRRRLRPTRSARRKRLEVALGGVLRDYRFDRYRTKEKPEDKPKPPQLTVLADDARQGESRLGTLQPVAEGVTS